MLLLRTRILFALPRVVTSSHSSLQQGKRTISTMMSGSKSSTENKTKQKEEATPSNHQIVLDRFCLRQFNDPQYSGAHIEYDPIAFETKLNEIFNERNHLLVDGYAPFCKHLFIENFTNTRVNVVPITQSNTRLLQSEYEARTARELPVLVRYFPSCSVTGNVAKYLDIILYSREQIQKENAAMGVEDDETQAHAPWGVISIKAQDVDYELPMTPITIMRNALGKEEGGSGVSLNREEYLKSVEYWKTHAIVK